jgi:hypothetical protein
MPIKITFFKFLLSLDKAQSGRDFPKSSKSPLQEFKKDFSLFIDFKSDLYPKKWTPS